MFVTVVTIPDQSRPQTTNLRVICAGARTPYNIIRTRAREKLIGDPKPVPKPILANPGPPVLPHICDPDRIAHF